MFTSWEGQRTNLQQKRSGTSLRGSFWQGRVALEGGYGRLLAGEYVRSTRAEHGRRLLLSTDQNQQVAEYGHSSWNDGTGIT